MYRGTDRLEIGQTVERSNTILQCVKMELHYLVVFSYYLSSHLLLNETDKKTEEGRGTHGYISTINGYISDTRGYISGTHKYISETRRYISGTHGYTSGPMDIFQGPMDKFQERVDTFQGPWIHSNDA